jgi:hypothetical protein
MVIDSGRTTTSATLGLAAERSTDNLDIGRFDRIRWTGLKGETTPYPVTRSGRDLRGNRQRLLNEAILEQLKKKDAQKEASGVPERSATVTGSR